MGAGIGPDGAGQDIAARVSGEGLFALEAAYRRVGRRVELAGTVGVIGGLALGAVLLQLRSVFAWAPVLDPIFFAGGWAIAFASAAIAWRRQRKLLAAYQFSCPACDVPMLTRRPWRAEVSRAELAASTGSCPRCGAKILA